MPTFKRPVRHAHVTIEGGDYDGLELTLNLSISLEDFVQFTRDRFGADSNLETQNKALEWFAENVLIDWNMVEEDDTKVPATLGGFLSLEPAMALEVAGRWRSAVTEVGVPLVSPSASGALSKEPSTRKPAAKSASRRRR